MKKRLFALVIFVLAAFGSAFLMLRIFNKDKAFLQDKTLQPSPPKDQISPKEITGTNNSDITGSNEHTANVLFQPIENASARVTKKPFGIYITPNNSPVQPERFSGFHTGADFETFPDEKDKEVSIYSICNGTLLFKRFASGYGGVLVEKCQLEDRRVTVIYGHLSLASIDAKAGDAIKTGDRLGILGQGFSQETDGERKHLHLGIHTGTGINISGYVKNRTDLNGWIDPCKYVCQN